MILRPSYTNRCRREDLRLETVPLEMRNRKPMSRWSVGRVTLLGDACHAMLPFMAQGAAQAIEDGATLAACLSNIDTRHVPQALNRYERLRRPRATRVQGLSEDNKRRFHLPDGPGQLERDAEMARGTTDWSLNAVDWLYGHDASRVGDSDAYCVSRRPSNNRGIRWESNEFLKE
jgi:salicylate hydroxylase